MTVDFIILGAQKCATSTLFEVLTRHPRIIGSRIKEPHFFSTSPDWRRELPQYEALFEATGTAAGAVAGAPDVRADDRDIRFVDREVSAVAAVTPVPLYCEASTSYTFYPHRNLEIWDDIYAYNPAMRFIYVVRDPIDRIVSSYMHHVARGYTAKPIEDLVREHPLLLDATRYYTQIIPFVRRFGRDHVLLLDFDDLILRRQETLARVAEFLGVDAGEFRDLETVHANPSVRGRPRHHRFDHPPLAARAVRTLMPALWARMVDRFSPTITGRPAVAPGFRRAIIHLLDLEIRELEHLMDCDLDKWRRREPDAAGSEPEEPVAGTLSVTE